jgi:hypothetical protein
MRYLALAGFFMAAYGCGPDNQWGGVRSVDVESWKGVPLIELEKHAFFSTLPIEKKRLSDGSELWDHASCGTDKTDTKCTSSKDYSGDVNTNCSGGQEVKSCCHHQFIVREGHIEEYRPIGGACYTGCGRRPGGVCR